MKVLACIKASPPIPLHGKGGQVGIEECGIVYNELQRLKHPKKAHVEKLIVCPFSMLKRNRCPIS